MKILKKIKEAETEKKKEKNQNKQTNQITKLENKKKRLKIMFLDTQEIDENEYLLEAQKVNEEIGRIQRQNIIQNSTKSQKEKFIKKTEIFLKDFSKFWKSNIGKKERREWIQMTIKRIWIKDERIVAIEPRDEFKSLFVIHRKVIGQVPLLTPVEFLITNCSQFLRKLPVFLVLT